jgi:hypothetical protein
MEMKAAPPKFIRAIASLLDDEVAAKVRELLDAEA